MPPIRHFHSNKALKIVVAKVFSCGCKNCFRPAHQAIHGITVVESLNRGRLIRPIPAPGHSPLLIPPFQHSVPPKIEPRSTACIATVLQLSNSNPRGTSHAEYTNSGH